MNRARWRALTAVLALGVVSLGLVMWHGRALRSVRLDAPLWLVALTVVPLVLAWPLLTRARPASMRVSMSAALKPAGGMLPQLWFALPDGLRVAALALGIVALARPQSMQGSDRVHHEGIDIVVALDLSESMASRDLLPNRLEAAKIVMDDFIVRRPHDRIGIVAFGAQASTVSPLTVDHGVLRAQVASLDLGMMDGSLTAIGAGIGVALNRLKESTADSQVIVLLTDGVQTAGGIDPDVAAKEAAERGVRIYTILMGQHGLGDEKTIDPSRLEKLASVTGGFAYQAADARALTGSFQDLLNKLDRSEIEGETVRPELYGWLMWPALFLLVLDVLLRNTWLRRFP